MEIRFLSRVIFLITLVMLLMIGCGGDEYLDNVDRIEIGTHLLPRRLTAGTREFIGVIAYNKAGIQLDGLSGLEVYSRIKWESSANSVIEVEPMDPNDKSIAIITLKKSGSATITASVKHLSDSVTLTVE